MKALDRAVLYCLIACTTCGFRPTPAESAEASFEPRQLDDQHGKTQVFDVDRDGDLDIVSIAWRDFQYLHLWRNDAIGKEQ